MGDDYMRLFRTKNRRGVTLVEILIVLGLLSLITAMLFSFFIHGTKIYSMGYEKSAANQDTSIAAFSITNTIKIVNEISLSYKLGYKQLDVQRRFPQISNVEYTITEENGIYSLEFTLTHQEGYSIDSKVLLNNIKNADIGPSSVIWFLTSDAAIDIPNIAIGSRASGKQAPHKGDCHLSKGAKSGGNYRNI
jgi:prepilin-type N-terminal cleavage/methylation domain-containing protein